MAKSTDSDYNTRFTKSITQWEKDHIQGEWQVVIKPRQKGGVKLNEFENTRLSFVYAIQGLEKTLFPFLRENFERLASDISELGMPPAQACERFSQEAIEASKQSSDLFRQFVAEWRSAKKSLWDERERQFSEDEIDDFGRKFDQNTKELRDVAVRDFESQMWRDARHTKESQTATVDDSAVSVSNGSSSTNPIADERRALLSAYKVKGRKLGIKITDAMVAEAANPGKWNDRTMVTWWKRNDTNCKRPHDKKIRAVLARDPSEIWSPNNKPKHRTK